VGERWESKIIEEVMRGFQLMFKSSQKHAKSPRAKKNTEGEEVFNLFYIELEDFEGGPETVRPQRKRCGRHSLPPEINTGVMGHGSVLKKGSSAVNPLWFKGSG